MPVEWVVDVADHALTWFLGTAFEYLERERRVRVAIPDLDRPVWSGLVALDRRALRLVECCDDASRALYGCLCRASSVDVDWRVRARPAAALEGDAKEAPGEAPTGTATRYARLAHAVLLDGRKVRIDDAFTVLECVDGFSDFEQLVVDGALQYAGGKDSARKAARREELITALTRVPLLADMGVSDRARVAGALTDVELLPGEAAVRACMQRPALKPNP